MSEASVTLATVEAYLESRGGEHRSRRFPPALEAHYDAQMHSYRSKVLASGLMPAVLIYNVFLIADFLLLPDTFALAAVLHFAVVTPVILLVGLIYPRVDRQWLREIAATAIPFLMVAQIMFIYALNRIGQDSETRAEAAEHYQYLAVMIVIYMNVIQRFGFRLAIVSTITLVTGYLAVLLAFDSPFDTKFIGTSLMLSGAYLSLIANQRMEQDVRFTFLRRLRDQLLREGAEEVSMLDALTGLSNRRQLERRAEKMWALQGSESTNAAVLMIDIDFFKPFNDRYGHLVGDNCLKRIAGAIASEKRNEADLTVRYGGEEFLVLLSKTDLPDAVRVAERVRRQIENLAIPNEGSALAGIVTASLGVAAGPVALHSLAELVASADAALYAAKRNGRNQVWPPIVSNGAKVTQLRPVAPRASKSG